MTLHIEIDRETEKQLAAIANLEKLSVEEVVTSYVKDKVREREEYNAKLRAHLAVGEAQLDRGEFSTKTAEDIIREGKERYNARKV